MATLVRIVLGIVAFVVVLAAAAVGVVLFTDANRFKPTIAQLAQNQGLWINLEGDLAWSLVPTLGVVAKDVQADWSPDPATPFLSAQRLALGVELIPLLSTQPVLKVNEVELQGLKLNLELGTNGRGNWEAPATPEKTTPTQASTGEQQTDLGAWHFDRITVTDAVVRYEDLIANQTMIVHDLDLEASDVAFGEPFPAEIHLDFELVNQATHVLMDIATDVTIDASQTKVTLDALRIAGELERDGLRRVSYSLIGRMTSDALAGAASVQLDPFYFGRARLTMSGEATGLYEIPKLKGHLDVDVPETATLSAQLGLGEIPIERVALAMDYDIEGQSVALSNVQLTLDETLFQGKLELSDDDVPELTFDLATDALAIDRYLQSSNEPTSAAPPAPDAADVPFFEREMISGLHWRGRLTAKTVVAEGLALSDAELITDHHNAIVSNTVNIGSVLKGRVAGSTNLDATAEPRWTTKFVMNQVDAQALADWIDFDTEIDGRLEVNGELTAIGNTAAAIAESLTGDVNFDGGQGTVSIAKIRAIGMAVAVIAGRKKKVEKWPDTIDYSRMVGALHLEGMDNQEFAFALDNFEMKGKGGYDLRSDTVDYKGSFIYRDNPRYNSFPVPEIFVGVSWPVRCKGPLDADTLCNVGKDAAGKIIAQLLTKQVGRQLLKALISPKILIPKKPEEPEE